MRDSRSTRAFSHGCIRVYKPLRLANAILDGVNGWSAQRISNVLASQQTTKVILPKKIPVHILYATSFAQGGQVHFRPDLYGRDRKLHNAIFARPTP